MKLNHFSLGTRLAGGFALVLCLTALMMLSGIWRLHGVTAQAQAMMETPLAKERLFEEWYRSVAVGVMRYTAIAKSGDNSLEQLFAPEVKITTARGNEISKAIEALPKTPEEAELINAVYEQRKLYIAAREKVSLAKRDGPSDHVADVFEKEFRPASGSLLSKMQVLLDFQHKSIDAMSVEASAASANGQWQLAIYGTSALIVGFVLAWLLTTSITRPLKKAAGMADKVASGDLTAELHSDGKDEVSRLMRSLSTMTENLRQLVTQVRVSTDSINTASSEIAMGNLDLSSRTEQTASNLQQTAASMEQLTAGVQNSAKSANEANSLASSAAGVAERGGQVVAKVVATMDAISASSAKIADITGVIDSLAFQTNILALNAAVEAARAGEQGRGFAVVAGEVRTLAQRSAQAAREIKTLISESVERVEGGSKLVGDAGRTMADIVESVQRVTTMMSEIALATREQSEGIGQVSGAVSQLDQMTQQNAALVEESAAAAESLKHQATSLSDLVGRFRIDAVRA
jgi:methyl-accepting chemotaxis protein